MCDVSVFVFFLTISSIAYLLQQKTALRNQVEEIL